MNALIIIDIQNDFCEGGTLEVPNAKEIIPIINSLSKLFELVVLTKDSHPQNHISFYTQHVNKKPFDKVIINGREQILWPEHCIQNTRGADFHPLLVVNSNMKIVEKGKDPLIDSYSAFYDNFHLKSTGLSDFLIQKKVESLYICGLATDYCVKFSVLDALNDGFKVYLIKDCCRHVNKGDSKNAFDEMKTNGAILIHSNDIINRKHF